VPSRVPRGLAKTGKLSLSSIAFEASRRPSHYTACARTTSRIRATNFPCEVLTSSGRRANVELLQRHSSPAGGRVLQESSSLHPTSLRRGKAKPPDPRATVSDPSLDEKETTASADRAWQSRPARRVSSQARESPGAPFSWQDSGGSLGKTGRELASGPVRQIPVYEASQRFYFRCEHINQICLRIYRNCRRSLKIPTLKSRIDAIPPLGGNLRPDGS
jgi:hypothetical protein